MLQKTHEALSGQACIVTADIRHMASTFGLDDSALQPTTRRALANG